MTDKSNGLSFNVAPRLKMALRRAIKGSGLSREVVADEMNEIIEEEEIDRKITVDQINSWTKNEKNRNIPLLLLPIFCQITKSLLPLSVLSEPLNLRVITSKEENILKLGEAQMMKRMAIHKESAALIRLGLDFNLPGEAREEI